MSKLKGGHKTKKNTSINLVMCEITKSRISITSQESKLYDMVKNQDKK